MRPRPKALPIDEEVVADVCGTISVLNRTERRIVHAHLLDVARDADDKSLSDNGNVISCRMTQDEHDRLLDWCEDHATTISAFARVAVRDRLTQVLRTHGDQV